MDKLVAGHYFDLLPKELINIIFLHIDYGTEDFINL